MGTHQLVRRNENTKEKRRRRAGSSILPEAPKLFVPGEEGGGQHSKRGELSCQN